MGDRPQKIQEPDIFGYLFHGMGRTYWGMPFKVKASFLYLLPFITEKESLDRPLWNLERDLPHLDALLQHFFKSSNLKDCQPWAPRKTHKVIWETVQTMLPLVFYRLADPAVPACSRLEHWVESESCPGRGSAAQNSWVSEQTAHPLQQIIVLLLLDINKMLSSCFKIFVNLVDAYCYLWFEF